MSNNVFGKRLRMLREQAGLLNKEFATIMRVEPATVTNWEKGNRFPDQQTLVKIADYFNVTLDFLLGRTNAPKASAFDENIEGHNVHIEYNKNTYPDGLTHEQVIAILKTLKVAGFSFAPKKE